MRGVAMGDDSASAAIMLRMTVDAIGAKRNIIVGASAVVPASSVRTVTAYDRQPAFLKRWANTVIVTAVMRFAITSNI